MSITFCILMSYNVTTKQSVVNDMAILLVPNEFPTIQQAFTAAKDGDCILIAGGVYPAGGILKRNNITITTDLTPVTIGSSTTSMDTGITIKGDNNLLSHVKVTNFAVGIAIAGNKNQVDSCELLTNQDIGLTLAGCKNCITHTCFFSNVNAGITILNCVSNENSIDTCHFSRGLNGIIDHGNKTILSTSIFESNTQIGLTLASDNSIVEKSSFNGCGTGILVAGNCNLLRNNIITLNTTGIKVLGDKNTFNCNIIFGNTSIGIAIVGNDQVCDCNTLKNNTTNLITKDIPECQIDYDF